MADVFTVEVDDNTVRVLQQWASKHGRSLNDEVCAILEESVREESECAKDRLSSSHQ